MHVEDVVQGSGPPLGLPDVAGQHLPGDDRAPAAGKVFEQLVLLGRQDDLGIAPQDPAGHAIDVEIGAGEAARLIALAAARQGLDPGGQLGEGEGLHEIIVRAGFEAPDAVLDSVLGGQDEDRQLHAPLAQGGQELEPAHAGQHEIEEEEVEAVRRQEGQSVLGLMADEDVVPLGPESLGQGARHLHFVLDNQDAHNFA